MQSRASTDLVWFSQISKGRVGVSVPEARASATCGMVRRKRSTNPARLISLLYARIPYDEELAGPGHALLIWPCAAGDCRSFTVRIEQKALAVDHLPVLRDQHVMQERPSASISLIACAASCRDIPRRAIAGKENSRPFRRLFSVALPSAAERGVAVRRVALRLDETCSK